MFSDADFGALGVNIDLTVPVINLDETGYGLKTQSMDVLSGVFRLNCDESPAAQSCMCSSAALTNTQTPHLLGLSWVVFEEPGFSGESFLLEKGQYGNPEDWGSKRPTVASAMPVVLVQLFPEADFRGSALVLEDSEGSLPPGFSVGSCKVLAGSWLAFEGQEFSGRMYVLDEGSYPDLRAMGCVHASATILSLQVVGFEFSLPSIVLFERCGLKGKRLVLSDGEVNLLMSGGGGRVQSVLVEGGMWVLYEEINYRGAQMLLRPGEVSDWRSFSGWKKVGSLRPLLQKQVHFHIRSRQSGHLMTVTGDLDDIKLLRVQEMEESQGFEQICAVEEEGESLKAAITPTQTQREASQELKLHFSFKRRKVIPDNPPDPVSLSLCVPQLLEECCLCPSSSVTIAGARVGLAPALDDTAHLWNIAPDGVIAYSASPNLVLEVKGKTEHTLPPNWC
ncbi:hypothetical protein NL108_018239 [Boleophthalmus pectinirostris]|nr:hypothetical protein NL108_018239 [Boleophthalmus pectinirostris]